MAMDHSHHNFTFHALTIGKPGKYGFASEGEACMEVSSYQTTLHMHDKHTSLTVHLDKVTLRTLQSLLATVGEKEAFIPTEENCFSHSVW